MFHIFKMKLLRWLASIFLLGPRRLNTLVRFKMPKAAAVWVNRSFDKLAPKEERLSPATRQKIKWDFFNAAQFLLRCHPFTVAAIFIQWFHEEELRSGHKPQVIVMLWLTNDRFTGDADISRNVIDTLSVVAKSDMGLLKEMLKNLPASACITFLDQVRVPPVAKAVSSLPDDALAYALHEIRKRDPERFAELFGKLSADKALHVDEKLRRLSLLCRVSDLNPQHLGGIYKDLFADLGELINSRIDRMAAIEHAKEEAEKKKF